MDDNIFNGDTPVSDAPTVPAADAENAAVPAENEAPLFNNAAAENDAPLFDDAAEAESSSNSEMSPEAQEILDMFLSNGSTNPDNTAEAPAAGFADSASQQQASYNRANKNPYSQTQSPEFGTQNRFYNGYDQQPGNAPRYGTNPGGYQGSRQYTQNPGYGTSAQYNNTNNRYNPNNQYNNPNAPYGGTAAPVRPMSIIPLRRHRTPSRKKTPAKQYLQYLFVRA